MGQITVDMRTLDLRNAAAQPVTGTHVRNLQGLLNAFLRSSDTPAHEEPPPLLSLDGAAGSKTRQMVLLFQSAQGLVQDAIVGPLTWKQLIEFDLQL
jgi:peptidoglycan hydrolase-like protein with peptidoglycan-binding domain